MSKTAKGLSEYAKAALGCGYVWGTFGQPLTEALLKSKIAQYPKEVGGKESIIRKQWLKSPPMRTMDCVGLFKAFLWMDAAGKIVYKAATDYSTGTMFKAAPKSGTMSNMPNMSGIGLYKSGHMGVYIGGGQVIEANSTAKGVIQTPLKGTGATAWSNWFYVPGVDYSGAAVTKPTIAPKPPAPAKPAVKIPITIKKGKKGFVVRQLQTLLNENGAKLAVDGDFGKLTDTEVRAYQKKNGLVVDGIVGVKTWGALLK